MFIGGLFVAMDMNGRLELHRLAPETFTPTPHWSARGKYVATTSASTRTRWMSSSVM